MSFLNQAEVGSPLWQKLVAHHDAELVKLRARIENPRITEAERIELAWRITGIKKFLALGNPEPETVADAE
jgi:hypothetical protein